LNESQRASSAPDSPHRHFGKSTEEAVEMFGMTLLWLLFLRYAMQAAAVIRIEFTQEKRLG
jgi:hypothetical protein